MMTPRKQMTPGLRRNARAVFCHIALSLASLFVLAGCVTAPVVVNDSQLNWLEVNFRPASAGEKPCKINLIGVGYIDYIEGTSPRVASGFATDADSSNWQDVYQERLGVPSRVIRAWLQRFADAGVMTENRRVKSSKEYAKRADMAVYVASINREKATCATTGEAIVGVVRDLIQSIRNHTVEDVE